MVQVPAAPRPSKHLTIAPKIIDWATAGLCESVCLNVGMPGILFAYVV